MPCSPESIAISQHSSALSLEPNIGSDRRLDDAGSTHVRVSDCVPYQKTGAANCGSKIFAFAMRFRVGPIAPAVS
jgi:hypothetical protein